jgi:hypothetical protein
MQMQSKIKKQIQIQELDPECHTMLGVQKKILNHLILELILAQIKFDHLSQADSFGNLTGRSLLKINKGRKRKVCLASVSNQCQGPSAKRREHFACSYFMRYFFFHHRIFFIRYTTVGYTPVTPLNEKGNNF